MEKVEDLFSNGYSFRGMQREQSIALSDFIIDANSNSQIFDSTVELFMSAALVGCYYDKRVKPDKGETRKIFSQQLSNRYNDLMFIYRLVMLSNMSVEESTDRINNAFRKLDEKENCDLFEEYVLGGLEVLYNNFFPDKDSQAKSNYDNYFDRLREMLTEFKENDLKEDDIEDLIGGL